MSADYRRECPACPTKARAELKAIQTQLEDAYGKVSLEEYKNLEARRGSAMAAVKYRKRDDALGEYYEIYYSEEKQAYIVDFSAECDTCGFSFAFNSEHKVELP